MHVSCLLHLLKSDGRLLIPILPDLSAANEHLCGDGSAITRIEEIILSEGHEESMKTKRYKVENNDQRLSFSQLYSFLSKHTICHEISLNVYFYIKKTLIFFENYLFHMELCVKYTKLPKHVALVLVNLSVLFIKGLLYA